MKATEIMPGDWLRLRYEQNGEEVVKDFRVGQIRDDYGDMCVWSENGGNMGELEPVRGRTSIEPIRIGVSVLKPNGFDQPHLTQFSGEFGGHFIELTRIEPFQNVYPFKEKCHWEIRIDRETVMPFTISYLHELQHLFLLLGIEKEIVL